MTTTFVLVSGTFTGGWLWHELATHLRAAGAEAHPATLTGMGDRRHLAHPGTGLDTHIEDLVQLIDHLDPAGTPEAVLVGHCYGICPTVGAADRRPERVSRVVYLDSPLPEDGRSLLDQIREDMPDSEPRTRMLTRIAQAEDGWRIPAPAPGDWDAWGAANDLPATAGALLQRMAAPQPARTYTQPLGLTGAARTLPATGIFCTAGGTTVDTVQTMADTGDPRVQWLIDERTTFFDLHTGHYPMLSAPAELAALLLRAAAGEGRRLTRA
ncbi:alpha/beta fold hydrolase [Streptomyces sp. NPDC001941]|uniref:alpha/beta fold hydrolase n=1 Tax=Streptomyces sp. NPDC001941 TaxID=3154659 RepID=UPI00331FF30D